MSGRVTGESCGRDGMLGKPWAMEKAKTQRTTTHFILGVSLFSNGFEILMKG
uniref:Uncharacterized protein n=1 Tax=Bursaphelenchus xylophilus TaxID=6326 RepID=A0A1I7SPQ9_BURXY